jgi:pimeloyl-ACP methyl ester carboxylesterase
MTIDEAPTVPARRRRRWLRISIISALVLVVLLGLATVGVGWYFSGQLLVPDNSISYPLTVKAIHGDQVTITRDADSVRPVVQGLRWAGGEALLTEVVTVNSDTVVRTVSRIISGTLSVGLPVAMNIQLYDMDPQAELGLKFSTVSVSSEVGALPAWFVPPTSSPANGTWIIAVHGRAGTMEEPLRILPTLAAAGYPTLILSYRNDPNAPTSPDGFYHLGDSEWHDVDAAVRYARANGATKVVLYGWSMGGTLTLEALRRMPAADTAMVRGIVLDSPAVDWTNILDYQGGQRGLPGFVTWTAERIIELRGGYSLADLDLRSYAPSLPVPTLLFIDSTDDFVPIGPAQQFAAAAPPGRLTLVTTTNGGHTGCWNASPAAYQTQVTSFLTGLH